MYVRLGNKRYRVMFDDLPDDPKTKNQVLGQCDEPNQVRRQILLDRSIVTDSKLFTEVVIHECLHAQGWHIDEEFVERAGQQIASVLYDLGLIVGEWHGETS